MSTTRKKENGPKPFTPSATVQNRTPLANAMKSSTSSPQCQRSKG